MDSNAFRRYSLYLNPERDHALIEWLERQPNASRAIREQLQRSLEEKSPRPPCDGAAPDIDTEAVRQAIAQALEDRHLSLGAIRQALEGVLDGLLGDNNASPRTAGGAEADNDDWLGAALDDLVID